MQNLKRKFWLLTTEYPPFHGGGISTYCYQTARMLTEQGFEVYVFINDAQVSDFSVERVNEIQLIRFNPSRTKCAEYLGHVTSISFAFAYIVKDFINKIGKPDIIEAQEYLGIAYYLMQFKYLKYEWCEDIPIVITMHSPAFLYLEYNHASTYQYPTYWIGEMERFTMRSADVLISPSKYLVTEVQKRFKFSHPHLFIIPNPFEFSDMLQPSGSTMFKKEIVFLGKLSAQKGVFKMLKYFENLWNDGFDETLTLIGGQDIIYHPEAKEMGSIVKKKYRNFIRQGLLKLEKKLLPTQISSRLSGVRLVIIPSTVDNLPYVVLEVMALGLIVLVSKQGGQSEIVEDGIDGFVFDHYFPQTFKSQLKKILALSDKEKCAISLNAKEKVRRKFCYRAVFKEKEHAINTALQSKQKTRFPFLRQLPQRTMDPVVKEAHKLLSVVVPYYNMGQYIDETIKSIKNTDIKSREIVIVNDGTTDAFSLTKLNEYRSQADIKIIDTANGGLARARNLGAESATGKYLAFLDADDKIASDYYSKAIRILDFYENVAFVGAWTQYFEGSEKIWPTFNPEPPIILYHNLINSSALVYKKEQYLAGGKNDWQMPFQGLEDYESVISLLSNGYNGVSLPETLFYYRVRKNSMIRDISLLKKKLLYEYISKKHTGFYGTFATDIFNLSTSNGPGVGLDNPTLDLNLLEKMPFGGKIAIDFIKLIKRNPLLKQIAYKIYREIK